MIGGGIGSMVVRHAVKKAATEAAETAAGNVARTTGRPNEFLFPVSPTHLREAPGPEMWRFAKGAMGPLAGTAFLPGQVNTLLSGGEVPTMDYTAALIDGGRLSAAGDYPEYAHVYGPDRTSVDWPYGLDPLTAAGERNYEDFTEAIYCSWEMFGQGPKSDVPDPAPVVQTSGEPTAGIAHYQTTAENLRTAYQDLEDADSELPGLAEEAAWLSDTGQQEIEALVEGLRDLTTINPSEQTQLANLVDPGLLGPTMRTMTEDEFVAKVIDSYLGKVTELMDVATQELQAIASQVDMLGDEEIPGENGEEEDAGGTTDDGFEDPYADPDGNPYTDDTAPGAQGDGTFQPIDLGVREGQDGTSPADITDPTGGAARDPGVPEQDPVAPDGPTGGNDTPVGQPTPTHPPGTAISPTTTAPSPTPSGMGDLAPLLPYLMNAQHNPDSEAELDPHDNRDDLRHAGGVPIAPAPAPASAATPQTTPTNQTGQPGQTGQPSQSTAPPRTPVSSSQPLRVPDTDGRVVYTFPDGRTQEVSPVVAAALDAALDNAAGTDATAAYARTTVSLNDRNLGDRVDPHQLVTGDVARWDQRTALLVAFDTESSGTLEAIVAGQLRPFTPEMRDGEGDFGPFAGFFHPRGIEHTGVAPTSDFGAPAVGAASDAVAVPA